MKKTKLEEEVDKIEQELLDNPELDKEIKDTVSEFRSFCRKFPEQVKKWKELINKKI